MTLGFVSFMALLTWLNPRKFWCIYVMILGVAVQMGYQIGMVGTIVWLGLGKLMNGLYYAVKNA